VFVRTIQDMIAAGKEVTLTSLPKALRARGINIPPTATHLSALKGWLRLAGLTTGGLLLGLVHALKSELKRLTEIEPAALIELMNQPLLRRHMLLLGAPESHTAVGRPIYNAGVPTGPARWTLPLLPIPITFRSS
jgi:hypothetical protein